MHCPPALKERIWNHWCYTIIQHIARPRFVSWLKKKIITSHVLLAIRTDVKRGSLTINIPLSSLMDYKKQNQKSNTLYKYHPKVHKHISFLPTCFNSTHFLCGTQQRNKPQILTLNGVKSCCSSNTEEIHHVHHCHIAPRRFLNFTIGTVLRVIN